MRIMKALWKDLADRVCTVPYVARAALPEGEPRDLDVSVHPGLVLCHFLVDGDDRWVLSVWKSKRRFDRSATDLRRRLRSGDWLPVGFLQRTQVEGHGRWKRPRLIYGFLVHLVAVIATLAAIRSHFDWLFARPDVVARVVPIDDVVIGDSVAPGIEIDNMHLSYPVRFELSKSWSNAPEGYRNRVLVLPCESEALALPGAAIDATTFSNIPSDPARAMEVVIPYRAHAGWLTQPQDGTLSMKVRVWPKFSHSPPELQVLGDRSHCIVTFDVLSGQGCDEGVRCSAGSYAERVWCKDAWIDGDLTGDVKYVPSRESRPRQGFKVSWELRHAQKMTRYRVTMHLESVDPLQEPAWERLVKQLDVEVDPNR